MRDLNERLSRKNSRRNMADRTETGRQGLENLPLSKRRSRTNVNAEQKNENEKDREIRRLQERLRDLEPETVVSHHIADNTTKNSTRVQRIIMDQSQMNGNGSRNDNETNEPTKTSETEEINEMKTYLAGVMAAITNFEKRLSTRPDTCPIPTDRS